jgi:hypothetical protein
MKKTIVPILLLVLISTACSKDLYDKRLKYAGNYHFITITSRTPIKLPVKDTIYYQGTIDLGENDNQITVHILPYLTLYYTVFEDGTFGPASLNGYFLGEFIGDNSVYFNFMIDQMVGHVIYRTYYHVEGTRIN